MVLLQRHHYADAATAFRTLIESFPNENALLDRARVYLELCERELLARPAAPRTVEERLTAATASLNNGEDRVADRLAREVLASDPENDLALYLLAAVESRRGRPDLALQYLSQAVAISPEAGLQAKHDADFVRLRGMEVFEELTSPVVTSAAPRRRRTRAER
jgi:tetratricopeptide (TPR) repeat protein